MADDTLAFTDLEFLTGIEPINMIFWTEKAQQCGNRLTWCNLRYVSVIVDSVPIMTVVIKLWAIPRKGWHRTTILLSRKEGDLGFNIIFSVSHSFARLWP